MVFGVFLSISKQCIQCACDHVWCYCLWMYIMCGFTLVGPQQAGTGQESVGKYVGPRPAYWAACATSPLSPRWNVATKRGAQQSFLLLPECPARQRPVLPAFTQPSLDGCTVFPAFTNLSNSTKDKVTKHAKEVERTQVAGHGGHRSLDCTSCIFCPRELPTQPSPPKQPNCDQKRMQHARTWFGWQEKIVRLLYLFPASILYPLHLSLPLSEEYFLGHGIKFWKYLHLRNLTVRLRQNHQHALHGEFWTDIVFFGCRKSAGISRLLGSKISVAVLVLARLCHAQCAVHSCTAA